MMSKESVECVVAGFLMCLMIAACTSPPHLVVYQADKEQIDLREWPVGYAAQPPHAHPQSLSPETMHRMLRSVYYRESVLFSFLLGNPKPLFTDYQIDRLTSTLPQAFDQALPQEVVAFRLRADADSSRYSSGFCFIADDALHLVVDAIRAQDIQPNDTLPQPNTVRTELVPRSGQRLFSTDKVRKGTIPNWIVIPLDTNQGKFRL